MIKINSVKVNWIIYFTVKMEGCETKAEKSELKWGMESLS
jgi:hypothetical protein